MDSCGFWGARYHPISQQGPTDHGRRCPITQPADPSTVTALLVEARQGNRDALDRLVPLVYEQLRTIARQKLRYERRDHTLSTTALVHEAYLKLVDQRQVNWQNRAHFFAVAAQAMRRILVNYAAARRAAKRGNAPVVLPLDDRALVYVAERGDQLLALDEALTRLTEFNERGARVVEYRFFGGLTHEEIAQVMGTSVVTVRRAWSSARAWLKRDLEGAVADG